MSHQFKIHRDDDTTVTAFYTHSPAEPMTRDHPGFEAEIEVYAIDQGNGQEDPLASGFDMAVLEEMAWNDHDLQQEIKEAA